MTGGELRLAIEQAWAHTQKTAPSPELEEAKRQLSMLRSAQIARAADDGRLNYSGGTGPINPPRRK